jgi:hypothetical protein
MRNSVTINGITLTREQIEKALSELNTPEPVVFMAGDIIASDKYPECHYMVLQNDGLMAAAALGRVNQDFGSAYLLVSLRTHALQYIPKTVTHWHVVKEQSK